jgi:hypothetical protein
MFNWLSRKAAKTGLEASQESEESSLSSQKVIEDFFAELEADTTPTFALIKKNYMAFFRERLDIAEKNQEVPPLSSAEAELQAFLQELEKFKLEVLEEICATYKERLESFSAMGIDGEIKNAIAKKVDDFAIGILDASLKELLDRVDYLRPLDKAWRTANPQKSTSYPPRK